MDKRYKLQDKIDGQMCVYMGIWLDKDTRHTNLQLYGQMDKWMKSQMEKWMHNQKDKTDGVTDRRMDSWVCKCAYGWTS